MSCGDREGIATRDLARLCREEGQATRAAQFYQQFLQTQQQQQQQPQQQQQVGGGGEGGGGGDSLPASHTSSASSGLLPLPLPLPVDSEQAEALLFLATFHAKLGQFAAATNYAQQLMGYVGPEGDEARNLLRELRAFSGSQPTTSSTSATATAAASMGTGEVKSGVWEERPVPMPPTTTTTLGSSHRKASRRQSQQFESPTLSPSVGGAAGGRGAPISHMTPSQSLGLEYTALTLNSGGGRSVAAPMSGSGPGSGALTGGAAAQQQQQQQP